MSKRAAKLILDKDYTIAPVDKRVFGSFIEHVGRAVYGGIYQPGHTASDGNGFRRDVLELVRELNVPVVRYPGGNFVSGYRWEDGIGPKAQRPVRADLAWRSLDSNGVGVDEFVQWARLAGAQPIMAVNLGTRGISSACNLLEYCNLPGGTKYSDMRRENGAENPHNIKLWCLGNEMDGPWQVGQKTAKDYGKLALQTARAMRMLDPGIELVSCGSSFIQMETFPQWEAETLEHTYEEVNYISLHQYFGNTAGDTADYLASTLEMDRYIQTVTAVCDYIKAKKRSKKTMMLSFDEWNVWFHSKEEELRITSQEPWQHAPRLLEEQYTHEDALMVGGMLISLINHADRVKIACLAQLVNALAPIMTEDAGVWRQPTYWPFLHASLYARGTALRPLLECGRYDSVNFTDVPYINCAAVLSEDETELNLLLLNKNLAEPETLDCDLRCFGPLKIMEHLALQSSDLKSVNSLGNEGVVPTSLTGVVIDGNTLKAVLPSASWNVIRLKKV